MTWRSNCVRRNIFLADYTSIRIGGPAQFFAEPKDLDELRMVYSEAKERDLPVTILGGGTNTLASDEGLQGLVIRLGKVFRNIRRLEDAPAGYVRVRVGGATTARALVAEGCRNGWKGLDLLAGLPGQVGGAVIMNAQNIGAAVVAVHLLKPSGEVRLLKREELFFSYRLSSIESGVIFAVDLEFECGERLETADAVREKLYRRNATQDMQWPSAGCAFRNPAGYSAGQLIDQAHLKNARIGDAQVSSRHANFIINLGRASCEDVLALMEHIQYRVRKMSGVELEPEVRILGQGWNSRNGH